MVDKSEPQGCRNAAIATSFLLGFAVVLMASGLSLVTRDSCEGLCETVGLTLLYAGGPVSALLGVVFGDLFLAWPLDVTLWVVAGFTRAPLGAGALLGVLAVALLLLVRAFVYGLVLSQFVDMAV